MKIFLGSHSLLVRLGWLALILLVLSGHDVSVNGQMSQDLMLLRPAVNRYLDTQSNVSYGALPEWRACKGKEKRMKE
jgi:hypothetical protein